MRSIRAKMVLCMCLLLAVSMLVLACASILLNRQTTRGVLEQTMLQTAEISASAVDTKLALFRNAAIEAGMNPVIVDETASLEDKQAVIDRYCVSYPELTRGNIIGADGISLFTGVDYNDRDYFHHSLAGDAWVSDPLIARTTGDVSIIVSAPVWQDGMPGTKAIGVIFFVPEESFLNDIVSQIKISPGAYTQVINSKGTIVAHPELAMVADQYNAMEEAKSDPSLESLAALESIQITGAHGFGTYTMDGVEKFVAYAPIAGSNGWSIGVNAPMDDFMDYTFTGIRYTVIVLVLALIVAVAISILFAAGISRPIRLCANRLASLAEGDLSSDVPVSHKKDETGRLLRDLDVCVTSLREMIRDVSDTLGEIASGNLAATVDRQYPGDFNPIHHSQKNILSCLNRLIQGIAQATDHLSVSADQISQASQELAENSTEQAASITDLSQSMNLVAERAIQSAGSAHEAARSGAEVKETANVGARQMEQMMHAVKEIHESGQAIGSVIKIIDDIAFQTNILALNAAVEAARAGQYGSGFAVVAGEVRILAAKSSEAARNTAALISDTIEKANEGYSISQETHRSLVQIIEGIEAVTRSVLEVSENSDTQSSEIETVKELLENQSIAIGQNSASSEETASYSEEMNAQAQTLMHLVRQFRLEERSDESQPLMEATIDAFSYHRAV